MYGEGKLQYDIQVSDLRKQVHGGTYQDIGENTED